MVYFQAFNRYSIFGKQIYNLCDSYYTVYTILPYFCLNCVVPSSFSNICLKEFTSDPQEGIDKVRDGKAIAHVLIPENYTDNYFQK